MRIITSMVKVQNGAVIIIDILHREIVIVVITVIVEMTITMAIDSRE